MTSALFTRRDMLRAALSAAAVSSLPTLAHAQAPADARLNALLSDFAEEILRLSPTSATSLGLDTGARAALRSQLEDASPAGEAR